MHRSLSFEIKFIPMPATRRRLGPLGLGLVLLNLPLALCQTAGSIKVVGETLVSAMMMMVGNEEKVYILDKVEGNPTQINGHPAWAVEWDIATSTATTMDMSTNTFCSSGMHLPNGSFATFGGNSAVTTLGKGASPFDPTYGDYDGQLAIRILNPCTQTGQCQWFDNSSTLAMQRKRWYSGAEALADGSVAIIGGFVNGGYINRNFPNTDPAFEGGAAEPTYEFFPANGRQPQQMQFMLDTSGLNAYAHTFLMPSGKMFVQANLSTILWDYNANQETQLPPMPNNVVRVYPASGAVAMLPLTPANNYTPTIIFCGGSDIPADAYGSYSGPQINVWEESASQDCQRITPEPTDGSQPAYIADDNMLEPRTMGQFIILPDGTLLVVNGGTNGTAGYGQATGQTPNFNDLPFDESFATGPVFTPALYNPNAPAGQRWSNKGFQASTIPRLYHSSAVLLPDASVLIAGSNPNIDYNNTAFYPTEYRAEVFYPPYFSASTRPKPSGVPSNLTYGGPSFDLTIDPSGYTGDANQAAKNTTVVLIRQGFTTHAMNMGQRMLQLNNTFTVSDNGTITLHVSQVPPNPNILTPGPVFLYVVVNGIPSTGKHLIVGSGNIEQQQMLTVSALPPSVTSTKSIQGGGKGSANDNAQGSSSGSHLSKGIIIVIAVGGVVILGVAGTIIGICISRRKSKKGFNAPDAPAAAAFGRGGPAMGGPPIPAYMDNHYDSAATRYGERPSMASESSFIPLKQYNESSVWTPGNPAAMESSASFGGGETAPYRDYDPYAQHSQYSTSSRR